MYNAFLKKNVSFHISGSIEDSTHEVYVVTNSAMPVATVWNHVKGKAVTNYLAADFQEAFQILKDQTGYELFDLPTYFNSESANVEDMLQNNVDLNEFFRVSDSYKID